MSTISERINDAVDTIENNTTKLENIVNGPATGPGSTVDTDNGPVKTAAAKILEIEERADDIYVARDAAQAAQAGAEAARDQAAINAALANQMLTGYARVAATSNSAISGLLTIDGITLVANDVVLLTAQSTGSQNGPWVAASGSWTRPTWYANGNNTQAAYGGGIAINGTGVATGGSIWRLTTTGAVTIGTTSTSWVRTQETTSTQASTVNDTRTASTAFVQSVLNASGARTSLGTISTAGNTNLGAATAQNRRRYFEVTFGAGSNFYSATLSALTENAQAGDELEISVTMPASLTPTVTLTNNTSGGTVLATIPVDANVSRVWSVWSRYNGTAWGVATVAPQNSKDYIDANVARTLEGAGLLSNGTSFAQVSNSTGLNITGSDFYVAQWFRAASLSSPSVTLKKGGDANFQLGDYILHVNPNGQVAFYASGTNPVALESATGLFSAGQWGFIEVMRSGSAWTLWLNGSQIASATNSTYVPNSTAYSLYVPGFFGGTNTFYTNGNVARTQIWNCAPDAAERAELFASLGIPRREQLGGSMTNMILDVGRNSDFSAGATDWASVALDSLSVVSGALRIVSTTANGRAILSPSFTSGFVVNRRYRVSLTVTNFSASGSPVRIQTGVTSTVIGDITGNGTFTFEFVAPANYEIQIRQSFVGSMSLDLDNIQIIPLGTLYLQPDADQGAGPVMRALTGSDTILPGDGHTTGGVVRGNPMADSMEIAAAIDGASGNSFVLGSDVQRIPAGYAITAARVFTPSGQGAANVTLGTSSGGAQIVAATAVSAGNFLTLTLVSPQPVFTGNTRLYLNRSATLNAGSKLVLVATKVT